MRRVEWQGYGPIAPTDRGTGPVRRSGGGPSDFEATLDQLLEQQQPRRPSEPALVPDSPIRFSRHAQARLDSRGIEMDDAELGRLNRAFEELGRRGAKESLVLTEDRAYVVGVAQRTVITVMNRAEALGNVFTNIDSTYVAS